MGTWIVHYNDEACGMCRTGKEEIEADSEEDALLKWNKKHAGSGPGFYATLAVEKLWTESHEITPPVGIKVEFQLYSTNVSKEGRTRQVRFADDGVVDTVIYSDRALYAMSQVARWKEIK